MRSGCGTTNRSVPTGMRRLSPLVCRLPAEKETGPEGRVNERRLPIALTTGREPPAHDGRNAGRYRACSVQGTFRTGRLRSAVALDPRRTGQAARVYRTPLV